MMLNVDVHIKMTTLVKANMKREEERSKVMAKLNFESHPIPQNTMNPTNGADCKGKVVCFKCGKSDHRSKCQNTLFANKKRKTKSLLHV